MLSLAVMLLSGGTAQAAGGGGALELPTYSVIPFAILLLCIAVLPLVAEHWWESNRNKLIVALVLGLPTGIYVFFKANSAGISFLGGEGEHFFNHSHPIFAALHEYVAFILLLWALFVISGGIYIRGTLAGTPLVNTSILAIGGTLASFIGTTGASMLLIRPLMRANAPRRRKVHVIVFFIFVVSNCGGLLTPLGDPPLFLGFLKGVPFTWTFGLWVEWLLVVGALLVIFHFLDSYHFHREDVDDTAQDLDEAVEKQRVPLGLEGSMNLVFLLGVILTIYFSGQFHWALGLQEGSMLALGIASIVLTPKLIREKNEFNYHPILEVAALFIGIFLAMTPAIQILNAKGPDLGLSKAWHYFWATGGLSAFLDNAPTYLTFAAVASGTEGIDASAQGYLAKYLDTDAGPLMLAGISCGAVFMGAMTYIGNGPNFMVKAIAEGGGIKMPSFFGYLGWSCVFLLPLMVLVSVLFFI